MHEGWVKKLTKFLYKFSFRFSKKVIFENGDDKNLFIQLKLAQEHKCLSVKGCGINTNHYRPISNHQFPDDRIVFTFIGRLLYDKGISEFVNAARLVKGKYPHAEFWVVGELDKGNLSTISKDQLISWVKNKIIRYHGTTDDIRKYIKKSDCIVLPSYREGLPKVLLEGMSMGKPLIATQTAGCNETIEEGRNGYLVPVGDAEALADAMSSFCQLDREKIEDMGRYSRQKALDE